jgi:hypothetical protein
LFIACSVSSKTSTGPTVNNLLLTDTPPKTSKEDHQDRPELWRGILAPPPPPK